jgi:hypothetical protein
MPGRITPEVRGNTGSVRCSCATACSDLDVIV